jgi:hypothetical protein
MQEVAGGTKTTNMVGGISAINAAQIALAVVRFTPFDLELNWPPS